MRRLGRFHPGVFVVPGAPATFEQRICAAVLAGGPVTVASHETAALLHGFPHIGPGLVEISTARPFRSKIRGVVHHRTGTFLGAERTSVRGVPVTSYARTLVDLSARLSVYQLGAALDDPDPVIIFEHGSLYGMEGAPPGPGPVDIERSVVRRAGRDVSLIASSQSVHVALAAAETLAAEGVEAEVIDLRSLLPLDLDTVLGSVARTGRLVVAHEAVTEGGLGAEIAAQVQERAWAELAAPVARVGAPFVPPPFAPDLERAFVPDADAIIAAVRRTLDTSRRTVEV